MQVDAARAVKVDVPRRVHGPVVVLAMGVLGTHVSIRPDVSVQTEALGAVQVDDALIVDPPLDKGPLRTVQGDVFHDPYLVRHRQMLQTRLTLPIHSRDSFKFCGFF